MAVAHRYKELRLGQLRAFSMVATHQSFSAAARALHLSHPVVWQQVRALERDFGGSLLRRCGRKLELTEEGRLLQEHAAAIVAAMDSLHQTFEDQRRHLPRTLVVASTPTIFALDMAQTVAEFCHRHPQIHLSVLTHQNPEIKELVATGGVDVGVMPVGPISAHHPLLLSEVLCARPWHLIMPKGHPLKNKRRIAAADLVRYPLILSPPEDDWRKEVNAMLDRAGVLDRVRAVVQIDSLLAMLRYVSLGLGVTVAPFWPGVVEFPNLWTRPLDNLFPDEHLVMLWRRGATPRPQARLFFDFARRHLSQE